MPSNPKSMPKMSHYPASIPAIANKSKLCYGKDSLVEWVKSELLNAYQQGKLDGAEEVLDQKIMEHEAALGHEDGIEEIRPEDFLIKSFEIFKSKV